MEKIKKFMLPENTNKLYDNEAISSISLTRNVADKINELVDAYNELSKIDLEWKQEQDGRTRKAILYMKDNLVNTLNDMVELLKNEGFFEARLEEYIDDLRARLDNLLGSVTEGSTTMDAEVIDMRSGVNGEQYKSGGTATRTQLKNIHENIKTLNELIAASIVRNYFETVTYTAQQNKIIELSGVVVDYTAQTTFYVSDPIECKAGEMFLITGSSFYNHIIAGFYDSFGNLLSHIDDGNSTTVVTFNDFMMIAPVGAAYFRIAYDTRHNTGSVKKLLTLDFTSVESIKALNNIGSYLGNNNESVLTDAPLPYNVLDNSLLSVNSTGVTEYTGDAYKVTEPIEIESGVFYKVVASANYGNKYYIMMDANNNIIPDTKYSDNITSPQEYNGLVWIPYGVKYIQIAYINTLNTAEIKKVISIQGKGTRKWSNINWCAFGDSLTEVNTKSNKPYHKYIEEETGINVLNYGLSGTGYARTTDNFYTRVLQLANVDFDIITFFGSGNDLGSGLPLGTAADTSTTTIAGCINKTIDNLYSIKPFVSVGIITPTPWNGNTPDIDNAEMKAYSDLLIEIAKRRSIPVLDLYRESNLHPESEAFRNEFYFENGVQDNGVHPNAKGHKKIASQIREFISRLI